MTAEAPSTAGTGQKRILIVEDDQALNGSLGRKFAKAGFQVSACFDGEQGIEHLQREAYDCVLLDLMMPVKDGFAVLAKLPATPNAKTPAYVLTTIGQDEKLQLARELGAKQVFQKSETSPAQVVEAISRELEAGGGSAG